MSQARFGKSPSELSSYQKKNFLNGPGKVCQALSLTRKENNLSLTGETLWVCTELSDLGLASPPQKTKPLHMHSGPRIGIDYAEEAAEFPWRFWIDT